MTKMMINILIIYSVLFPTVVFSQTAPVKAEEQIETLLPSPLLPQEFVFLLHTLLNEANTNLTRKPLVTSLIKLDQLLYEMTKEEMLYLIKSEIYKPLLRHFKNKQVPLQDYERDSVKKLSHYLDTNSKELSPYSRWFTQALISDLTNIMHSSLYPTFLSKMKKNKKFKNSLFLVFQKKLTLLLPWYSFITSEAATSINTSLTSIAHNTLENIINSSRIFVFYSKNSKLKLQEKMNDLHFFTYSRYSKTNTKGPEEQTNNSTKTVSEILNEVTMPPKKELITTKEWKPKADSIAVKKSKKFPANYPTPDPAYIPPKELPTPVTDWIIDF